MVKMYTSYKCKACRKEFILLTIDIKQMANSRYVTCPYCNSKKIREESIGDSLKECMDHRSYKRVKGALRQVE